MEKLERKIAAIMFTDIYGYSKMMSNNESKALTLLAVHDEIVSNVIADYTGKILKKMGDAIFAEFKSSVDALNCAINIQDALKQYNDQKAANDKIIIRIGLHVGDVIVKDNDLFGEGINVAARLEPLADPGGICISQSIYQSVKSYSEFNAIRVGEVDLKNIMDKYVIYKIPSLYEDRFWSQGTENNKNGQQHCYRIKKISTLPVKSFSARETAIFTVSGCLFLIGLASYYIQGRFDLNSFLAFTKIELFFMAAAIIILALAMIYLYANKAVRILFNDIRDVDLLLEFLVVQIGYTTPYKKNNQLIFKPSLYNFFMYSARKIKTRADGNSVIITGNYMFINKLLKLIRAYETAD